jgi:hypothetical protein
MRSNATDSDGAIAYIVDASSEGRTGFIMIDLGTGEFWHQLSQHPSTLRTYANVPSYLRKPLPPTTKSETASLPARRFR